MRHSFTSKGSILVLALVAVMATAGAGHAETPADQRPSAWAGANGGASSEQAPSLTNDIGAPVGNTNSQLLLGFGLVAVGLAVLVAAGAVRMGPSRGGSTAGGNRRPLVRGAFTLQR